MKKVLITGVTGFIGSQLVNALLNNGDDVCKIVVALNQIPNNSIIKIKTPIKSLNTIFFHILFTLMKKLD